MDLLFVLQFFSLMLTLICVALGIIVMRIDLAPMPTILRYRGMRRSRWPSFVMRAGVACVLASFALLVGGCYLLLTR